LAPLKKMDYDNIQVQANQRRPWRLFEGDRNSAGADLSWFHEAILICANLENCDNALFYTTDNKFKKKQEFSYKYQKKLIRKYDDDIDQVVTETYVPHLMKESVLKKFIDDPHQRLMYEFTGKDFFCVFYWAFQDHQNRGVFPSASLCECDRRTSRKDSSTGHPGCWKTGNPCTRPGCSSYCFFPRRKKYVQRNDGRWFRTVGIESQLDDILKEGTLTVPMEMIPYSRISKRTIHLSKRMTTRKTWKASTSLDDMKKMRTSTAASTANPMIIDPKQYLLVITGPTAVGKTSLTLQLARSLETEILSADSRQFYRECVLALLVPEKREASPCSPSIFTGHISIRNEL